MEAGATDACASAVTLWPAAARSHSFKASFAARGAAPADSGGKTAPWIWLCSAVKRSQSSNKAFAIASNPPSSPSFLPALSLIRQFYQWAAIFASAIPRRSESLRTAAFSRHLAGFDRG